MPAADPADVTRLKRQHTEILESFDDLYKSSAYSDLTVTCGEKSYKLHKAVVCPRSTFFANACNGKFKASLQLHTPQLSAKSSKEGMSNSINLSGDSEDVVSTDDPELIGYLMDYFYTLDYLPLTGGHFKGVEASLKGKFCEVTDESGAKTQLPYQQSYYDQSGRSMAAGRQDLVPPCLPAQPEEDPLIHARMYALGEYYGVPGLKDAARSKFDRCAEFFWYSPHFAEAADIVCSSTPESDHGLRSVVADVLLRHTSLIEKPEFEVLLMQHGSVGYRLLKAKLAA